jgi:hypothetical protein
MAFENRQSTHHVRLAKKTTMRCFIDYTIEILFENAGFALLTDY